MLTSGSVDNTIKIWRLSIGACETTLRAHIGQVFTVSWNPCGRWLASGGSDSIVYMWDLDAREIVCQKGHSKANEECTCRWECGYTYQANPDCIVCGHTDSVESVSWCPYGRWIASGSRDVRYGTRLGDLKENWFLLFSN
jgi:WD40 repeat protein